MNPLQIKQAITTALAGFASQPEAAAATALFETLGYRSAKRLPLDSNTPEHFLNTFAQGRQFNQEHAMLTDWNSVDFLFQLTDDEVRAAGGAQQSLPFDSRGGYNGAVIESYLFFAIALKKPHYSRTDLANITRAVNRLFSMPVLLLFRHGDTLTLAVINRRLHKRDPSKDVLEKVTLIKDICFAQPHRAHVEILHDLSFAALYEKYQPANFVQLHNAWQKTLDIHELNDQFFRDYKIVFADLQKHLRRISKDPVWAHDFALQLLNRLLFIYFIQRKYWLGKKADFLYRFWQAYQQSGQKKDTFYERWLTVLFFEAFNNKFHGGHRHFPTDISRALMGAPYLNGGLFIRNRLDEAHDPQLPDAFFSTLFDAFQNQAPGFLERYYFTIAESTPLNVEVAVDPEMIGKVYESLVNISDRGVTKEDQRGSAGIFYTPRVEIDLMCRLALVDVLANHLDATFKPLLYDAVFAFDQEEQARADQALAQHNLWPQLGELLRKFTVCDPACGSGSFLVGMLLVLDDLQARANAQLGLKETPYERRRRIIGEQLYGVDVKDWAVHVAELRLWLQLVVETELQPSELKFRPLLPNLSFKVRCGDSLLQEIGGINFGLHRTHLNLPPNLKGRITQLKDKKLRFFQGDATLHEAELKAEELALFRDILTHKKCSLEKAIAALTGQIESSAEQGEFPNIGRGKATQERLKLEEQWRAERDEKKAELRRLEAALDVLRQNKAVPFVWDLAFVEIFEGDKGGFDIVIGNPPYVRQEMIAPPGLDPGDFGGKNSDRWKKQKKSYKATLQKSVAAAWPIFFIYKDKAGHPKYRKLDGKSDLYIFFYFHGLALLNPRGSFFFITSNSWLDVGYGADLQEFLLKHSHIKFIFDNQCQRSFAQADVNTIIALLAPPDDRTEADLEKKARFVMFKVPFEDVLDASTFKTLETINERQSTERWRICVLPQRELLEEGLVCEDDETDDVAGKLKNVCIKTAHYEANKWGGKYLRAPEIFFTILEKGKGKLVRLGDIADVRRGITTGANEFFYLKLTGKTAAKGCLHVRNCAGWEGNLEKDLLIPVISSMDEVKQLILRKQDATTYLFSCTLTTKELKARGYSGALSYIDWGARQKTSSKGKHTVGNVFLPEAPSVKNHLPAWYSIEPHPPGSFVAPRLIRERFFFADNPNSLSETDMFFHGYVEDFPRIASALLNSTITYLILEITGRQGIEGRFNVYGPELKKLVLINPHILSNADRCKIALYFSKLGQRHILKILEEINQADRRALDEVVFDVLGLTAGERKAVYEAMSNLVRARLEKAKSV